MDRTFHKSRGSDDEALHCHGMLCGRMKITMDLYTKVTVEIATHTEGWANACISYRVTQAYHIGECFAAKSRHLN